MAEPPLAGAVQARMTWPSPAWALRPEAAPGAPPDLALGTKFRWKTFGVRLESSVREFVPYERLAWNARGTGIDAYHAWLLVPTKEGCRVANGETQRGWLARLQNVVLPTRMHQQHQLWLERLRDQAVEGITSSPR